ncbi:MAG: SDR family oxidoreductase [Idiomarina sp.]
MNTVIITGASRGLGLTICEQLLAADYQVVGIARTHTDEFKQLQQQYPGKCHFHAFDMQQTQAIHELCQQLIASYGRPWALVNNAAIGQESILATLHESQLHKLLQVNLEAPILMSKYLSRSMLLNGAGRVVNVTSIVAQTGFNGLSVYGATKAGLEGFTRSLARELGKAKVTVNNVAPGYMETDMTSGLQGDKLDSIQRRSALRQLATPADVAAAVSYLISDAAARVTGTTITVDAGSTA